MEDLYAALKRYWGYDSFRPLQERIVHSLVSGCDAAVIMPTGGGKSLCYQLPALVLGQTVVVISPLIALMQDQVAQLGDMGIPAALLNSSQSQDDQRIVMKAAMDGAYRLLYLSPERLARNDTIAWLRRVPLAFFAIYVLWGTTFLAIRIAVQEVPPLFAAGIRFFVAGVLLYGFMRFRGQSAPTRAQWRSLAIIGLLMFVAEYGPLFWAEKYVPSGIASVLEATLPLLTLVIETLVFRQQRFHWRLLASTLLGFCGVGVLLLHGGEQHFGVLPCVAILAGATAWSLGSVLNRSLDLPESRPLTAGAAMLLGG